MRNLRRRPDGKQVFAGQILGNHAARLHRTGNQALMVNPLANDMIGFGKSRVNIAPGNTPGKSHIIVPIFVDNRRIIGKSPFGRVDGIEGIVIDFDQVQCISGNVRVGRCNSDDGFANKTHFSRSKHGMVGHFNARKSRRICSRAGNPTNYVFDIFASDNRLDTG